MRCWKINCQFASVLKHEDLVSKGMDKTQERHKNTIIIIIIIIIIYMFATTKKNTWVGFNLMSIYAWIQRLTSRAKCIWRLDDKHVPLFMVRQPLVGQGLLIVELSRSHSDTPHSVGLLWTSDPPDAETPNSQHTTLTRDIHPCPWQDPNPQSQ
jgi:hypothetical protein